MLYKTLYSLFINMYFRMKYNYVNHFCDQYLNKTIEETRFCFLHLLRIKQVCAKLPLTPDGRGSKNG